MDRGRGWVGRRRSRKSDEESALQSGGGDPKEKEGGPPSRHTLGSGDNSDSGTSHTSEATNASSRSRFFEERERNAVAGPSKSTRAPPPAVAGPSTSSKNRENRETEPIRRWTEASGSSGKTRERGTSSRDNKQLSASDNHNASGDDSTEEFATNRKSGRPPPRFRDEDDNNDDSHTSESESIVEGSKTTSALLLAEDSLLNQRIIQEGSLWNVLVYGEPVQRTQQEIIQYEKLIYTPSSNPVLLEEKLPENEKARYTEDEGLFVGKPLRTAARNQNRLERRLITEKAFEWFEPDGQLFAFPNPYRPEPIQLFRDEFAGGDEINKNVVFVPAKLDPFQEFQLDPKINYEIFLDIGSLNFTHHYLFSKEHVLAARLELAMQEYSRRQEMRNSERAENKLKALREAIIHTKAAIEFSQDSFDNNTNKEQIDRKKHAENVDQLKHRILRYRQEMRGTRLHRDQSLWDERATLVAVVDAWKELKALRQDQGFVNSLLKLNIMTVNEDHSSEKIAWQSEIEQELADLQQEYEEEYELNMARYRTNMKEWLDKRQRAKSNKQTKGDAKSKNKDKPKKNIKSHSIDSEIQDEDGSSSESESSISKKPIPPPDKFDKEGTKKAIEKRFKEVKRLPGEPKVILELTRTSSITSKAQLPQGSAKEEQRRKSTQSTKIELRIRFNRKEVYRSKPRDLNADFSVFFGLTIPIVVNEWPETLCMEIVDSGTFKKKLFNEIDIPLPNSKTSIERCHMQRMEFYSEEVIKTNSAGVGSGVDFEILSNEKELACTSGYVTVRLGWSSDKDGNILCPKGFEQIHEKEEMEALNLSSKQVLRSGNLQKWSENVQMDPNDPQNARWMDMTVKNMMHSERKDTKQASVESGGETSTYNNQQEFVLDNLMEEFEFCSMESIENSLRYRLLQLRDEEVQEFRMLKMVAPFERDIPPDAFDAYEYRLKEDARKRLGETNIGKSSRKRLIEDDSIYETNRLEKIREMRVSVLQLFENSLKHITFEDIVIEEQMPDIGTLGLNLMTLFQPRRPLRPTRKERKRVQGSSLMDTKISLIVNIVRAFNLPMRKDTDVGLLTTESVTGVPLVKKRNDRNGGNYSTVKPFLEIWFQRNVSRTTTALGSNPTWNQELQLGLTVIFLRRVPNDDYSPENMSKMDDYIYLLVYDEVAVNLLEDDRRKETDIHQRLEKRWLGWITIPFSTLFTNGRIEGTFKINSPPILLGYEAQRMATHFGTTNYGGKSGPSNTNLLARPPPNTFPFNNQKNAFITLFITLQPSVNPSNIFKEDSATGESADMSVHVKSWKNSFQRKYSDRFVKPFVMTPDGDTVLCSRFLRAIEPPESLLNPEQDLVKTMEDLSHYVSLFPSVRDSTLGISDYGLWFTSDVFVMTPGGGIEDHAVLLACFFMYLNIPCWIVQGNAIPDGPTTYVVTSFKGLPESEEKGLEKNFKNAVLIWNPCNGEYYNANDNFCPLQKVWAAVGKLNMWVNIHEGDRPHQLDWDIGKSKQWLPLFPKDVAESKVPSLQPGSLKYKNPDRVQANSLAQRIERHLKDIFMKWRKTAKTNWNRYCSATLRRLLPKLEETKSSRQHESGNVESTLTIQSSSPTSIGDEHLMELREVMSSYQITGFPLQQPYVNMESITETVFATGVHTIDTPDVEFAVAAYAQAYPASVYSVWIYVAALHRRK